MWSVLRRIFTSTRWFGDVGEHEAVRYLRGKSYRILQTQMRNRFGEIDIIAQDGESLVFVEVKTRSTANYGAPFEAVTADKQRKLVKTALAYLKQHRLLERRYRFDVISIVWPAGVIRPQIDHYLNAFEASGQGQFYA